MSTLVAVGLANALVAAALAVPAVLVSRGGRRPALAHVLWLVVLLKLLTPPLFRPALPWLPPQEPGSATLARPADPVIDLVTVPPASLVLEPLPSVPAPGLAEPGSVSPPPAPPSWAPVPVNLADQTPGSADQVAASPGATATASTTGAEAAPAEDPVNGLITFAGIVWLGGALFVFGQALLHALRFGALLRHARPAGAELQGELDALARQMGLRRAPALWLVPGPLPPLVWGALGPVRIFFPSGLLDRLAPEERASLLAHELAHVRRRDHWVRWLEVLAAGLYWWYPLVWWARRQLHQREEECCDAQAVAAFPPRVYACAILETVDFLAGARTRLPAVASGLGARLLEQRLVRIFDRETKGKLGLTARLAVLLLAGLTLPLLPALVRADKPAPPEPAEKEQAEKAPADQRKDVEAAARVALADEPTSFPNSPINLLSPTYEFFSVAVSPDGNLGAAAGGMPDRPGDVRVWDLRTFKQAFHWPQERGVASVVFTPDGKRLAWSGWDDKLRMHDLATGRDIYTLSFNSVARAAISSDGNLLATATEGKQLRLWEAPTGKPVKTLQTGALAYYSLAFSRSGKVLAAGGGGWNEGDGGSVTLFDVRSHKSLGTLRGHTRAVLGIAFAPKDDLLATASADNSVRLWSVETRRLVATLNGHTNPVKGVAFSPDGKTLVTGSWDRSIRVWEVPAGKLKAVLNGHPGNVREVVFTPDGKRLLSGGAMRSVKVWDPATGKELADLSREAPPPETPPFLAGTLSPDGKLLAVATDGNVVQLREPASGDVIRTLSGHEEPVTCLAFGPDGKVLATGSPDKTIKLWDPATGKELRTLTGHTSWVYALAFAADGKTLASGGYDRTVRLWDPQTGKEKQVLKGHRASVRALAFAPDGKTLFSGGADRFVRAWDLERNAERAAFPGHEGTVRGLAVARDGKTLASGGEDGLTILWDPTSGKIRHTLKGGPVEILCVAFSPGGAILATGAQNGLIRVWDPASGLPQGMLRGHGDAVNGLAFAPGARALYSIGLDRRINLWQGTQGPVRFFVGHTGPVRMAVFSPDGKWVLSGGGWPEGDRTLRLWDVSTGKEVRRFPLPSGQVTSCAFTRDGKYAICGTTDGKVLLFEAETGKHVRSMSAGGGGAPGLAVSPDGKRLLGACHDNNVRLWDLQTGGLIRTFAGHTDWVRCVAFLPDGKRFVSGSRDKTVRLWEADTGKELHRWDVEGWVDGVGVLPDGKRFLAGTGKTARVFEVDTGKEVLCLEGHEFGITAVAVSPDGRYGLTTGYDGAVRLWDLSTGQERHTYRGHRDWVWSVCFSPDSKRILTAGGGGSQDGKFVPGQDFAIRMWNVVDDAAPVRSKVRRLPASK